jgi:hypothetical protein
VLVALAAIVDATTHNVIVNTAASAPVRGVARHSEQLMGITAYVQWSDFHANSSKQALIRELGIKSVGMQAVMTKFAPKGLNQTALAQWFAPGANGAASSAETYLRTHMAGYVSVVESRGIAKVR